MTSRSRTDNQFLSAAREYAERGWPVFPLVPRNKQPLTEHGFKEATHDRNRILEWWQVFPTANIGLATGIEFDVLDIDGPAAVPALQDILGNDYHHDGPVVSTGKGKHLYFLPVGGGNRAGLLGGGVDYRGAGGYVVAPPSVHPSGRVYRWEDGRDSGRALPVVPEDLAKLVLVQSRPVTTAGIRTGGLTREDTGVILTKAGAYIVERPDIVTTAVEMGLEPVLRGGHYYINCIFHHDPDPSLCLYTHDNSFYCYGCEARGDSINLKNRVDLTGRKAIY